jgi:hypothetical protein
VTKPFSFDMDVRPSGEMVTIELRIPVWDAVLLAEKLREALMCYEAIPEPPRLAVCSHGVEGGCEACSPTFDDDPYL